MSDGGVLAVQLRDRLYTGGRDGLFCIWSSPKERENFMGHGDGADVTNAQQVSCLAVSEDVTLTGGWDKCVIRWDLTGGPSTKYGPFGAAVNSLCIAQNCAVAACGDGILYILDINGSQALRELRETKGVPLRGVAASSGGSELVTASNDGVLRLWSLTELQKGAKVAEDYLFCVAVSGTTVATGGDDGVVTLLRLLECRN